MGKKNVKKMRILFVLMVIIIFFPISFTLKIMGSDKYVYLDSINPSKMDQYDGNEGDSFVYAIGKHQHSRGNKDVDGNIYQHGIEAWIARWNYTAESSWAYSVYKIDGKYQTLTGKAVLIDSYNITNFDTTLYFYGDGELLKAYQMTPDSFPFDISLDLTDVNELKIYVKDNISVEGGTAFGITECKMKVFENKHKIDVAKVSGLKKSYYYTGKAIKPLPQIVDDDKKLINGKDYSLTYKKNKTIGTATIVIKGKGNYYGKKEVTFKIVKQPKLSLSSENLNLCLVNKRSAKLTAKKNNISGKVKWKSSNTYVATVDRNGKVKALTRGTATITASINKIKAKCKVKVTDTATITTTYDDFHSFDTWSAAVSKKENELVFGGKLVTTIDGKTYYNGNIIVEREILSYENVEVKVSDMTPGYYKIIKYKLPKKVRYKLHRHNLSNDVTSEKIGKLITNLVEGSVVWSQQCSCGFESTLSWTIPEIPETINGEDVYIIDTTSTY